MSTVGELLIGKSVAYRAKSGGGSIVNLADVINLDNGAVAFFGEDGNLITAAAGFADQKKFYIYVGGSEAKYLRKSKAIVRKDAVFNAQAYIAPVKAVKYIGDDTTDVWDLNLPTTLVVGSFAYMSIIETSFGNTGSNRVRRYEYKVLTGDDKADVLAGLVAAINADADRLVNAVANGSGTSTQGIQLTAIDNDVDFMITASGILENATLSGQTNVVLVDSGSGRATQISALEDELMISEGSGNYTYLQDLFYTYAKQVDTAATYTVYNMSWYYTAEYPWGNQPAVPNYLTLAVVTGASQITTLDTLFAAAFGVVSGAEAETGAAESNEVVVSS